LSIYTSTDYDASWIDHVLNPTIGLPWQVVMRTIRAAQEENVDLLSKRGLLDPALIPFLGGFYSQKETVGLQEVAERVAEPLGFDPDSFAVQMGTAMLTDPLMWATLGLSGAGKFAAGVQATRQSMAKAGVKHIIGDTTEEFLKAAKGSLHVVNQSASRTVRNKMAKRVATLEKMVAKDPSLAKRTLASLTDDASREVAALRIPFPGLHRMQLKIPGLGNTWRNALLRPVRFSLGAPLIGGSKAFEGLGTLAGEAAGALGAGVSGQRGVKSLFTSVADTLMIPVDFARGLKIRPEDRIKMVSSIGTTIRALLDDPKAVERMAEMTDPDALQRLIQVSTGASQASAKQTARIIDDSVGSKKLYYLDGLEGIVKGDLALTVDTPQITFASDYMTDILGGSMLEKNRLGVSTATAQWRESTFKQANRFGQFFRKLFFDRTGSKGVDDVFREMLATTGEHSRYVAAKANDIGALYKVMAKSIGLPRRGGTEQVDNVFRAIFEILPQEADDFMVDQALAFLNNPSNIKRYGQHIDNYVTRLMYVAKHLEGVEVDDMSRGLQTAWKQLFPEIAEEGVVTTAPKFFGEVIGPLNQLSRGLSKLKPLQKNLAEADKAIRRGAKASPEARAAATQQRVTLTEQLDDLHVQVEGAVLDLRESLPALREDLYQRGSRVFWAENGKWHLPGEKVGSKAAMQRRAAQKGGKAVPVGAKAFNDVYNMVLETSADNLRISSNMGFIAQGSHPMAYVPRVLSARERTALDSIISSTDWDAEAYQIYRSQGSQEKTLDFVTTDALEQILWTLHKQGHGNSGSDLAQRTLDLLNGGGNRFAGSPVSSSLTRNTEYKYFESTGDMLDEILLKGGENFGALMKDKIPPGFSGIIGGGQITGLKLAGGVPLVRMQGGRETVQRMDRWFAEITTSGGKKLELPIEQLDKFGIKVNFVGRGSSPGQAMMRGASRGERPRALGDFDPQELLESIREAGEEGAHVIFGQGATMTALQEAASKEVRAGLQLPAVLDGVHRLVKMGVTTGEASFHVMNMASAAPMAFANGMNMRAFTRGTAAAVQVIWRTSAGHTTNQRLAVMMGDLGTDGKAVTGFADFTGGLGKVGVGVGAGATVDWARDADGPSSGTSLGATLGVVAALSRGSGAALTRAIETRMLRETGEMAFHTTDGSYTFKQVLEEGSKHGILNTFIESGTHALTAESKTLQDLILKKRATSEQLMAAVSDAGQQSEIFSRLSVYFGFMHMGLTPKQAARKTAATLFDYNDLTPFNQYITKRISSFATFGQKILESTTSNWLKSPDRVQGMLHTVWGHGGGTYGEDDDVYLDTSLGRAHLRVGERTVNIGRALPQIDLVNAIGYTMEAISYGSTVVGELPRNSVGAETMRAIKLGKEGITMGPETPGLLSGNVALSGEPPRGQETGNFMLDTMNAAMRNMILVRSVVGLFDDPERTGQTVYDQVEDGFFKSFGLGSEETTQRRVSFLNSRADRIEMELSHLLRRGGLTRETKLILEDVLLQNRLRRRTLNVLQ